MITLLLFALFLTTGTTALSLRQSFSGKPLGSGKETAEYDVRRSKRSVVSVAVSVPTNDMGIPLATVHAAF